jgi:uncharacterized protein YhaN
MEGRMDICWKGRNITIERSTRGRVIFGEFRAYETENGLDVPELTAANCGMELLGVERSVFVRAGFLKLSDMPVTQDDALRRRLNNLVTTGDEDGAADKLAQSLKELKNKCRYNKSGLLPQAETERDGLEEKLHTLQELNIQAERLRQRQKELDVWSAKLENHKAALNYAKAQEDTQHIREAELTRDRIGEDLKALETECAALPSEEEAERARTELQKLHSESMSLQMEQQMLPPVPEKPAAPKCFDGMTGEQAVAQAKSDAAQAEKLKKTKKNALLGVGVALMILGALTAAAGLLLTVLFAVGGLLLAVGITLTAIGGSKKKKCKALLDALTAKYETPQTELWISKAEEFAKTQSGYEQEMAGHQQTIAQLQQRREDLMQRLQSATAGEAIGVCMEKWEQVTKKWKTLSDTRRDFQRAESQIVTLKAMTKNVPAPSAPDELTQTLSETETLLTNAAFEQKQNQLRLGQFQGQAEALGQESDLRAKLKQARLRIARLEETYAALEVAQEALRKATSELQRRFAPRIAKRTEELFGKFTAGRYETVRLKEDLSLEVGMQQEIKTHSVQWPSDGTVDQLYLALRLAVAEELTPGAPLVLDDAMVRFDDTRLATALHILSEMAEDKQVILFTCQSREKKLQGEA